MSENIDVDSNNLCIPEDAFEKFQAVSMYQEEKIIILPQTTVPPNPKPPEPDENNPACHVNEVVLSSDNVTNSPVNSTQIDEIQEKILNDSCVESSVPDDSSLTNSEDKKQLFSGSIDSEKQHYEPDSEMVVSNSENITDMIVSNSDNVSNTGSTDLESPILTSNVAPRKRGRKPKNPLVVSEVTSIETPKNIQNPDISSTPFSSDPEASETGTVVKKRRGRPPKVQSREPSNTGSLNSDKDLSSELSSSDNNKLDDVTPQRRRRGRPARSNKKLSTQLEGHTQEQPPQIENIKLEEEVQNKQLSSSIEQPRKYKRRRTKSIAKLENTELNNSKLQPDSNSKILSDNLSDDDDQDDICLSQLKNTPDDLHISKSVEESFINDVDNQTDGDLKQNSSQSIDVEPKKTKKQRGRPKRLNQEPLPQIENNTESVIDTTEVKTTPIETEVTEVKTTTIEIEVTEIPTTPNETDINTTLIEECETDDTSLSKLKSITEDPLTSTSEVSKIKTELIGKDNTVSEVADINGTPTKRNTKMPVMADFEYNIDSVIGNDNIDVNNQYDDNSLLVEDTSKRPHRRKAKKLQYDEESDEDPFANVELSDDDEPRRGRRGNRYYSDDEYIPGKRGYDALDSTDTENSGSESSTKLDDTKKQRRKKHRKKSDNQSPRKRGKKTEESKQEVHEQKPNTDQNENDDVEICIEPSSINPDVESQPSQKWGSSTEFENFLAKKIQGTNLKIKKLPSSVTAEKKIEIPVINQDAKKTIEMCTQTNSTPTTSIAVQTSTPYDIPLKENIPLTPEQSEKACYFLNGIVKTTAELGLLMTQKSEDFIKKKINTSHVTDTAKMDYCVKKSFLLFKLAKHNLLQMEEDLAKQYDEFLKSNNLTNCREEVKAVEPTPKYIIDSDCEIVEVEQPPQIPTNTKTIQKSKAKPAFNPKTVFLNKELSIKIAKKPNESKKLDIKGRHAVWINDTVMVKKVKPTQSFLAQDSRNKKPPDNRITNEMVSDFFKGYYRQRVLSACAPFISTEWLNVSKECVCNYFVVKPLQFNAEVNYSDADEFGINSNTSNTTITEARPSFSDVITICENRSGSTPERLFTMCYRILKIQLCHENLKEVPHKKRNELTDGKFTPETLFRLCLRSICTNMEIYSTPAIDESTSTSTSTQMTALPLRTLCYRRIMALLVDTTYSNLKGEQRSNIDIPYYLEEFNNNCWLTDLQEITPVAHSKRNGIKTLFSLCVEYLQKSQNIVQVKKNCVKSLWSLCLEYIQNSQYSLDESKHNNFTSKSKKNSVQVKKKYVKSLWSLCVEHIQNSQYSLDESKHNNFTSKSKKNIVQVKKKYVKSLWSLCVEHIQNSQGILDECYNSNFTPKSLKKTAYEKIKYLLYSIDLCQTSHSNEHDEGIIDGLMINCVNTLSEEAFLNLEEYNTDAPDSPEYLDDFDNEDNFEPGFCDIADEQTEPSWVSQVQMQELRSCVNVASLDVNEPIITQIKLEPLDDIPYNIEPTAIKTEPGPGPDEMTIIPDIKPELEEHIQAAPIQRQNSNSYDVEVFEQFVSSNKLMKALTDPECQDIYSQSSARVRRQHEPDNYEDNDTDMLGLLVPHTYEPININTAKGSLMASSSDEDNSNTKSGPKKPNVKRRGRPKKAEHNKANNKNTPTALPVIKEKEKPNVSEVATLTRKMKERIRQDEKNNESTDSESENVALRLRNKKRTSEDKTSDKVTHTQNSDKPAPTNKVKNNEIQCNNVDSTDQIENDGTNFTGFTSIETNEMSNYEKYMKFVYDKVIPDKEEDIAKDLAATEKKEADDGNNASGSKDKPVVCNNTPVELLECEPTLPISDKNVYDKPAPKRKKLKSVPLDPPTNKLPYIERYGWHCYPVDPEDTKLYQNSAIFIEKLPESFVQTYFKYQDIATRDEYDEEIKKLTNLNSLKRSNVAKDRKPQNTSKRGKDDVSDNISDDNSRTVSAVDSDDYDELMPSDDDTPTFDDEVPPVVPRQTENTLAKNMLMDDKESDEEGGAKVKKEIGENAKSLKVKKESVEDGSDTKKGKASSKKKSVEPVDTGDLMLTADKMMNKELTLLHAPVVLNDPVKDTPTKGPVTRHSKKTAAKSSSSNTKTKPEEDSSSEEEKQWVTTKEKLLKRMGKKETASADDAKRAKLVSEFIERREGNPSAMKRRPGRPRRSGKRFLEREKQLRVLQRELFGEMSNDPTISKRSVAAWKGRRNIRKVLDKKSLARSTVIANMEEFERKRRLNARQTRLRELLGCEEGVNVLVINDEVCLEYDFEEHRPVVTIHPFFTKVMKAHQYEGVKFMWDACFESLAEISAGHAGGGCILAHCMGLGKTLQVLALLHTVLTHPRVGMHRVLVCCPLSTVLNWVDEIHKWIGPVTNQIKVFELSKLKKTYERAYQLEDWYNGGGIFIIGYELFRSLSTLDPLLDDVRPTIVNKIRTALLDPGPDIIVCDEGHLLKNDCSVLAVAMSRVVTKRRIVLTGTPMQNNLREYYCMVNFVKPNLLGTYSEYSNRFENPIMNGQHRDSSEEDIKLMKARTHILHKVLEGCLQRQEASVLYPYLPKKHEYTVFITLTKCQWDLYKHYLNHYSRQQKHISILKDFHILQKIWSHPQVLHNFQTKAQENRNKIKMEKLEDDLATEDQEDIKDSVATELWWLQYLDEGNMLDSLESSNKFVVVFRILDECVALGDKVLIFSTSLFCLDALEYFLKKINKWSLGQEYYRLDGSVPAEVRQKWCREFNAENNINTKLFLVSTRAGCLGLNMTAANRVIIMDTSWNPAHDIQSIFRVYRFGQKKDCYIYRLVAMGTMEQKIYERSVTKQAVACRVVDEQQIDRHYNMAELTELYRYDEAGATVAGGVAVGVCDVALLRVARETALHAVHEHDSLLRSSEQGLPEHERAAAWMQFQQEQAHKQMENELITNIPKIALKRVHGENYTTATSFELNDIKIKDIKAENSNENAAPSPEPKTRRGKKITKFVVQVAPSNKARTESSFIPPHIIDKQRYTQFKPDEPGTSKAIKENIHLKHQEEENIVRKITEILVQHNFQNRRGNDEIAKLVSQVRQIVKQGYIFGNNDNLTTSIAKVLLPKPMALPVINNIMCESINNSDQVIMQQQASTPGPANAPLNQNEQGSNYDSRTKRKAALAAEKHIDSISQDVIINLDDEFDSSDTDFVPNIVEKPDKTQAAKRKSGPKEKTNKDERIEKTIKTRQSTKNNTEEEPVPVEKPPVIKPKPGPKTYKEKLLAKVQNDSEDRGNKQKPNNPELPTRAETSVEASASILLSDDDDVATNTVSPAPIPPAEPPVVADTIQDDDDEVVPLPLALLSNKNFINIVAHTYLNGNPMLDADAATLAAQYSTFKSLKEAEQTGRDIVSGPLYDIAVRVIGKTLFKRMHIAQSKTSTTTVDATNVSIELKEKMDQMTENKSKKDMKSKIEKKKKTLLENAINTNIVQPNVTIANCSSENVVPVGLIQTRESLQNDNIYATSECILPDDDGDMHIVPHDLPAPAPPATITPTTSQKHAPVVLNHTLASSAMDPKPITIFTPHQPQKNYIKINRGKIILPTAPPTETETPSNPSPAAPKTFSNQTICLDSDEEETITPTLTPVYPNNPIPIPGSLTTSAPVIQATPLSAMSAPGTSASKGKPVILRQVPASTAQKLKLVPSNAAPTPKYTKILPKDQKIVPQATFGVTAVPLETNPSVPNRKVVKTQTRFKPGDIIKISETGQIEVVQSRQTEASKTSAIVTPNTSKDPAPTCKPGDIIKISEKGDLEVLKSSQTGVSIGETATLKTQSAIPKSKHINKISNQKSYKETEKPKPSSQTTKLNTNTNVQKQSESRIKMIRRLSISSSSSDENPLSILKNVVRIEAADESVGSSTDKFKPNTVRSQQKEKSNVQVQHMYSKSLLTKSSSNNEMASKTTPGSPKVLKDPTKHTDVNIPKDAAVKNHIQTQKNKLLTNLLKSPAKVPNIGDKKPSTSSALATPSASSVAIFKEKKLSSTLSTVDLTKFSTVKSGTAATMLKTKIEAKKRVSSTDTNTVKKKKTELMTLKDFNIDDIDDIIELD